MKIELNVSAEQVQDLETDLKKFMLEMTDEQKVDIMKEVLKSQFNTMYLDTSYCGRKLTDFGESLTGGLREIAIDKIADEVFEGENIQEILSEVKEDLKNNFSNYLKEALVSKMIKNIMSPSETEALSREIFWRMREGR